MKVLNYDVYTKTYLVEHKGKQYLIANIQRAGYIDNEGKEHKAISKDEAKNFIIESVNRIIREVEE